MLMKQPMFRFRNTLSPVQVLLLFYLIAVIVSTILLALPVAYQPGVKIPFIDILFTAVSALSVTGLSSITISDTLSLTGIIILMFILQLGAVGIMAIGTFIWIFLGKRIGLKERQLIMTDQNQSSFEGAVRLIKQIVLVLITIEALGFLVLGTYYLQYYPTAGEAYLHGFFGAVSAITNAGFDLTGESLIPFKDDYFVQFVNMLLIIFGAIGFPVLIEVKGYIFAKPEKRKLLRFSLFTKVTTVTFFGLIVGGAFFIYLLDSTHFFKGKAWHEILFYSLFQSVSTKSAGLTTMDLSLLTDQNHLFMSSLMFIGASPSSTGGGIRTTTFALVVIFIITYARGGRSIQLFRREIYEEDLLKAVTITMMAGVIVFISVLVMTIMEPFPLSQILFEVTSAFGTVGMSLGITGDISTLSKIILMFLMFIGRVGIITFLFTFKRNKKVGKYRYPKEKIIIG